MLTCDDIADAEIAIPKAKRNRNGLTTTAWRLQLNDGRWRRLYLNAQGQPCVPVTRDDLVPVDEDVRHALSAAHAGRLTWGQVAL